MHDLNETQVLRGGLAGWQVKTIMRLAATRLGELRVSGLASEVKLSSGHFGRAFRVSFGLSPREWLLQQKMDAACGRLRDTDDSIEQIAADLGYRTSSQFCRAFRGRMRRSPQAFRRA